MDLSIHYFIRIILIWLLCLLSVLLHELGHAAGYRISGGSAEWKVSAGSGPKIFSISKWCIKNRRKIYKRSATFSSSRNSRKKLYKQNEIYYFKFNYIKHRNISILSIFKRIKNTEAIK